MKMIYYLIESADTGDILYAFFTILLLRVRRQSRRLSRQFALKTAMM
jgi:hypothetical protein